MAFKSSWIVIAAIFLGQSAVLAAPVEQSWTSNPYSPSNCSSKGKYDHSSSGWGGKSGLIPQLTHTTDKLELPALTDSSESQKSNYGKKANQSARGFLSNPSSRDSCDGQSGIKYPGTEPGWGGMKGVIQDPIHTNGTFDNITYPDVHDSVDPTGRNSKTPIGTISDPTDTQEPYNSTDYPNNDNVDDSYAKKSTKPLDGILSDPTHTILNRSPSTTEDPYENSTYPGDQSEGNSYGKNWTKPLDGSISDPTFTEGPTSNTAYPVGADSYAKKASKKVNGTISSATRRPGHTPSGKPCTVPSSGQYEVMPFGDKNSSYLGGMKHVCVPDVPEWQQSGSNSSNSSYPEEQLSSNSSNSSYPPATEEEVQNTD